MTARPVRHLTTEELAERYGPDFSPRTVERWRATGTGPKFLRVGKRVVYPVAEIEAWEKTRLVDPAA